MLHHGLLLLNLREELLRNELDFLVQELTHVRIETFLEPEEMDPGVVEGRLPVDFLVTLLEVCFPQQLKFFEEAFSQFIIQVQSLRDFILVKFFYYCPLLNQGLYDLHLDLLEKVVFTYQCFWSKFEIQVALKITGICIHTTHHFLGAFVRVHVVFEVSFHILLNPFQDLYFDMLEVTLEFGGSQHRLLVRLSLIARPFRE